MTRNAWLGLLLVASVVRADVPVEVAALQRAMHRLIDGAKPAIGCVLVSRSKKYAAFENQPTPPNPGQLGGFDAPRLMRFTDVTERDAIKRLDLANPENVPDTYGSAVVIDASGLLLTNYHVIDRATKIYVRLPGQERGSYADILAGDARADLAVLKLLTPPAGLQPLKFGDGGAARDGDWIVSMANPFAAGFRDGKPSSSWGIISNVRQRVAGPTDEVKRVKPLSQYGTLLQIDARLNFGCSGGALLNMEGELIGLTTALAAVAGGETAGGYAIPLDRNFKQMINVLKRGEEIEYGFLGVSVSTDERGDGRGSRLRDVAPGTPAARAGLRADDLVVKINGFPVRDNDDLFLYIAASLAGSEAEIEYRPSGARQTKTVKVRLVKAVHSEPTIVSQRPKPVHGLRVDYVNTQALDQRNLDGVLIKELEPGSPAEKKLKPLTDKANWLIVAVNGNPVSTPAEFYREASTGNVRLDLVEIGRDIDSTKQRVTLP